MEKNGNDIIIPFKELEKVIPECLEHISNMLKTAKHLHNNDNFEHSIIFHILALEEINKFSEFVSCYKQSHDVTRKILKNLKDHKYKSVKTINSQKEYLEEHGIGNDFQSESMKKLDEVKEANLKLNFVKQLAMYYDRCNGITLTLKTIVSSEHLKSCSVLLYNYVEMVFSMEKLIHKYGNHEGWFDFEKAKGTEEYGVIMTYQIIMKSPEMISNVEKYFDTLEQSDNLYKDMKKKNLLV